jgi:hypothetical protein
MFSIGFSIRGSFSFAVLNYNMEPKYLTPFFAFLIGFCLSFAVFCLFEILWADVEFFPNPETQAIEKIHK